MNDNSIDQQFVEFVVKSLVSNPSAVQVQRRIDEKGVLLELTVDPEDLGRVIGKRGATAQSLRTLLRALGTKNDARYNLKIIDNGEGSGPDGSTGSNQAKTDDYLSTTTPPVAPTSVVQSANDEDDAAPVESDRMKRTREELKELDDLDV